MMLSPYVVVETLKNEEVVTAELGLDQTDRTLWVGAPELRSSSIDSFEAKSSI
jgi:hypothetical protein